MAVPARLPTRMSTKGQIILPKAIRDHKKWGAGTRLVAEETAEGVLLRAAPAFAPTSYEEVFGSLKFDVPAKTLEEMDAGITAEVRSRHARGRY